MSEFLYLPTHRTMEHFHGDMRKQIEVRRTEYKKQILSKAAGILLFLKYNHVGPDAQIDTVAFVGKESRSTIERSDNCWIITHAPVTLKDARKINSPSAAKSPEIGNITPLLVAREGFVLTDNVKLILPYNSLSVIGEQPTLTYIKDSHYPDFVDDKNIGKDGYIDTGIMAGLDRLLEQAKIIASI